MINKIQQTFLLIQAIIVCIFHLFEKKCAVLLWLSRMYYTSIRWVFPQKYSLLYNYLSINISYPLNLKYFDLLSAGHVWVHVKWYWHKNIFKWTSRTILMVMFDLHTILLQYNDVWLKNLTLCQCFWWWFGNIKRK